MSQFKGAHVKTTKRIENDVRGQVVNSKGYEHLGAIIGEATGEEVFQEIVKAIEGRPPRGRVQEEESEGGLVTPSNTQNPEPPTLKAPRISDFPRFMPAMITGQDPLTPTPSMIVF